MMPGELLFRDEAFPGIPQTNRQVFENYLHGHKSIHVMSPELGPLVEADVYRGLDVMESFLQQFVNEVEQLNPAIIGFSSVFQQNLAAVAMARRVKEKLPGVISVLGGANASSPMGTALLEITGAFDFVFSGEADHAFVNFAEDYLLHNRLPADKLVECAPVQHMNDTPIPEYNDYFEQRALLMAAGKMPADLPLKLPLETSRGCWWGEKNHCTFCGLNGKEMSFRDKTAERVLQEVEWLAETCGVTSFQATDNIMPLTFRKEVLPFLAALPVKKDFFYEVKSNLKEDELDLFCQAGVNCIQPGIESFSTAILKQISKGVKGIQNIWLLRECLSRRIQVTWNILAGIPNDELKEYEQMLLLLPAIEHLPPPMGVSQIIINRYSPYHFAPERFNITEIIPGPAYANLYPAGANLQQMAYHFSGNFASAYISTSGFAAYFEKAIAENWVNRWNDPGNPPKLYGIPQTGGRLFIEDTRSCATDQRFMLNEETSRVLQWLRNPQKNMPPADTGIVEWLLEKKLVVFHENSWLSVVAEPAIGFALRTQPAA
jgi:ribosomal peptide maturation radical SAM protein 1